MPAAAWDFAVDGSAYAPELTWDDERAEEGYDCPRCGEWIPAHRQHCAGCGLDTETLGPGVD